VVVTFNYRVGPYGFLAGEEVVSGGSLNNGLKDQRKALKWVHKHISKVSQRSRWLPLLFGGTG
jgi:carboxylesterase type B